MGSSSSTELRTARCELRTDMATLPVEGRWSLKSLGDDDAAAALAFLRRDPMINVYLISRILEERSAAATQMFAVRHNRDIIVVASLATNIVLAADSSAPRDLTDTAIALIADRIVSRMLPVRAIISPAPLVEALWKHLKSRLDPPTVVRMNQPIYAIRRRFDFPVMRPPPISINSSLRARQCIKRKSASIRSSAIQLDIVSAFASWWNESDRSCAWPTSELWPRQNFPRSRMTSFS